LLEKQQEADESRRKEKTGCQRSLKKLGGTDYERNNSGSSSGLPSSSLVTHSEGGRNGCADGSSLDTIDGDEAKA
jgi:hypothetical protein